MSPPPPSIHTSHEPPPVWCAKPYRSTAGPRLSKVPLASSYDCNGDGGDRIAASCGSASARGKGMVDFNGSVVWGAEDGTATTGNEKTSGDFTSALMAAMGGCDVVVLVGMVAGRRASALHALVAPNTAPAWVTGQGGLGVVGRGCVGLPLRKGVMVDRRGLLRWAEVGGCFWKPGASTRMGKPL